ncbi:hypothetical protein Acr_28g0009380 [Actinidia rufa]|uniref:GIR1-like zinc ribbon domain-containing protein n=1 Tax=Actinidia rufa TaxID=165716 RepID=A0A7J0HAV8_9ERIC|nr:hypothetical protein Acr_28g0009380 [Actinidia rufa]
MSHKGNGPKLDLKLNLSPPRAVVSQITSPKSSPKDMSPRTSCVSSDHSLDESFGSPETKSMMLVGCPQCLMYIMLSEEDPKCPKCKTTVFFGDYS